MVGQQQEGFVLGSTTPRHLMVLWVGVLEVVLQEPVVGLLPSQLEMVDGLYKLGHGCSQSAM